MILAICEDKNGHQNIVNNRNTVSEWYGNAGEKIKLIFLQEKKK